MSVVSLLCDFALEDVPNINRTQAELANPKCVASCMLRSIS